MPTVELHSAVDAEAVWEVLVDLDAWPQWGPTVQGAEASEPGPLRLGSHGKVSTPLGVSLPFTITEFEAGRCWTWEVAGIGGTRHEVWPEERGSRLIFGVPWWATAYLPVCAIALQRIARIAGERESG
jgi:Polyketide cyclase / dehydrase and lipid transport